MPSSPNRLCLTCIKHGTCTVRPATPLLPVRRYFARSAESGSGQGSFAAGEKLNESLSPIENSINDQKSVIGGANMGLVGKLCDKKECAICGGAVGG